MRLKVRDFQLDDKISLLMSLNLLIKFTLIFTNIEVTFCLVCDLLNHTKTNKYYLIDQTISVSALGIIHNNPTYLFDSIWYV